MGLNPKSGGFAQKVSDLQNYGLTKRNVDGSYALTEICQKIFQTTDTHQISNYLQSIMDCVGLWKLARTKYGGKIIKESFINDLIEYTAIDPIQGKARIDDIIHEYMKDWDYMNRPSFEQTPVPAALEPYSAGKLKTTMPVPPPSDSRVSENAIEKAVLPTKKEDVPPLQTYEKEDVPKTFELVIRFKGVEILPITDEHLRSLARSLMVEEEKKVYKR